MYVVDHPALAEFLETVAIPQDIPVMIWGQPGIGKSDAARQLAKKRGALLIDIRLSQYDSVDMRGIPTVDTNQTVWNMPSTMPFEGNDAFPDDQPIIVFFDEINSAAPSVMAVAYQLVLDRACGEHRFKPNVHILAAGNREGDKGVTNKMPLPLADRFCHVELGVSADAAISYMMDQGLPGECVAFLSFRKPLVSTFDPSKGEKVFATPRSWMRAFDIYRSSAPDTAKRVGISGYVGEGPAVEFWSFIDQMDKVVPVRRILANPHDAPIPDELSMCYATAVSVSGAMDTKTTEKLHTYLSRMDPEFMVLAWQMAVKRDPDVMTTDQFLDLANSHRNLFRA